MSVIANTTVISNFAAIQRLSVLRQLFGVVYLSTEVYDEIRLGLNEGYVFYAGVDQLVFPLAEAGWLHLTSLAGDAELQFFGRLPNHLHSGEASSLAIAHQRKWLFLTDDLAARKTAIQNAIKVSGTLGCLVLSVQRGQTALEQANRFLSEMIQQGYHAPITDLTPFLTHHV